MLKIRSVGVVGAGLMGRQIALVHARHGLPVRLFDTDAGRTEAALDWIRCELGREAIGNGGHSAAAEVRAARSIADAAACDLVIESVVEDAAVKRAVLTAIAAAAGPHALIASNTSSIPLAELATSLNRRERLCGLHFCHPVSARPLVEVVPSAEMPDALLAEAAAHVRSLELCPLVVPDGPGFLLNRLLAPYLNAAIDLLERGAAELHAIEAAAVAMGMPVGPFAFLDAIGLDTAVRVGGNLYRAAHGRLRPVGLPAVLFKAGQLGEKTGAGFLLHDPGRRDPGGRPLPMNPAVRPWLSRSRRADSTSAPLPADEIRRRLWDQLCSEVARAVAEGAATSADAWQALALGVGFRQPAGGRPSMLFPIP
jgi:3-hydroxyacyl-CoA dehydrogenase